MVPYLHLQVLTSEYSAEGKEILRENCIQDQSKLTLEIYVTALINGLKVNLIIHEMAKKRGCYHILRVQVFIFRFYCIYYIKGSEQVGCHFWL